jgi:hypothetical protein
VGLRAAPTRQNSQVLSELAGRVTRHCRALAMHSMHVLLEMDSQCSVSARAKVLRHFLSTVPGALVPCQPFRIYAPRLEQKPSGNVLAPPLPIKAMRCHHDSGFCITSFPLMEVGLFTFGKNHRVHRTPGDPEMLPCKLSDLMATNLHKKAIPVN